jgi:hypothetical protein
MLLALPKACSHGVQDFLGNSGVNGGGGVVIQVNDGLGVWHGASTNGLQIQYSDGSIRVV